ncbi:MAG: insulinase family protein [Oscillospiraceae bacterium]|jgi:predicted Zn-dependent peptidase|nr:insulinase family protein [Oscillospiraceae bacterium]
MLERIQLHDGVFFNGISETKFKSSSIIINFVLPLTAETACQQAILPYMLHNGFKECPDITEFHKKLMDLYSATIITSVKKVGAYQIISMGIEFIEDEFVPEKISERAIELLISSVFCPIMEKNNIFCEQILKKQKEVLKEIVLSELNDKYIYTLNRCHEIAFEGTNCAVNSNGTISGIENLTTKTVSESYFNMLKHAHIEILGIGHVPTLEMAKNKLKKAFENFKGSPSLKLVPQEFNFRTQLKEETQEMNINQTKLALLFIGGYPHTEKEEAATKLMSIIYGGSPTSKLFVNVREKMGLCYYCSAMFNKSVGSLCVAAGIEQKNLEKAKNVICSEFKTMQNGDFTDKNLTTAKLTFKQKLHALSDSSNKLNHWYLARILDQTFKSPEFFMELIDQITPQELVQQAEKFTLTTIYVLKGGGLID